MFTANEYPPTGPISDMPWCVDARQTKKKKKKLKRRNGRTKRGADGVVLEDEVRVTPVEEEVVQKNVGRPSKTLQCFDTPLHGIKNKKDARKQKKNERFSSAIHRHNDETLKRKGEVRLKIETIPPGACKRRPGIGDTYRRGGSGFVVLGQKPLVRTVGFVENEKKGGDEGVLQSPLTTTIISISKGTSDSPVVSPS